MQTNSKKKLQHISKPLTYVQRLNLNRSLDQSDWSDLSDGSDDRFGFKFTISYKQKFLMILLRNV